MDYTSRYPAPDPTDPLAPLWLLRSRSSANGGDGRSLVGNGPILPPGLMDASTHTHGNALGPLQPLVQSKTRRASIDISQRSKSPPIEGVYATELVGRHKARSDITSSVGVITPVPPIPPSTMVRSGPPLGDSKPQEQPKRKHRPSDARFAQILLPIKKTRSTETSMGAHTSISSASLSKRPSDAQSFVSYRARPGTADDARPPSSQGKAAISPPIATSLVWESQVTGRKFVSISSNPIYGNAGAVHEALDYNTGITLPDSASGTRRRSHPPAIINPSPATPENRSRTASPLNSPLALPAANAAPIRLPHGVSISRRSSVRSQASRRSISLLGPNSGPIEGPFPEPLVPRDRGSVQFSPMSQSRRLPPGDVPLPYMMDRAPSTQDGMRTAGVGQPEPKSRDSQRPPSRPSSTRGNSSRGPVLSITSSTPHTEWSLPTVSQLAYAASLPIFRSDGTSIRFGSLFEEHRTIVLFVRHFFCPASQDYVSSLISLVRQPEFEKGGVLCDFNPYDAKVQRQQGEKSGPPKQVQLVLIGCGKPGLVEKYREIFEVPFRMFTDPDGKLYECLGMGNGRVSGKKGAGAHRGMPKSYVPSGEMKVPGLMAREEHAFKAKMKGQKTTKLGLMKGLAVVMLRALKVGMPVWENGGDMSQLGGEFVLGPGLTCNYAHRMQTADGHAPIVDVLVAADVDMPSLEETKPAVPVEKKVLKRKKSSRGPPPTKSWTYATPIEDPQSNSYGTGPALHAHRTLRTVGSANFPSREPAGYGGSSYGHQAHDAWAVAPEVTQEEQESQWMDWRQSELDRLRVRKDTRRTLGTSFLGSELSLVIPEEGPTLDQPSPGNDGYRYAHHNPLRYKSGAASLASLGNVGMVMPLPPIPAPLMPAVTAESVKKPAKLQTKRSKASSISASVRNLVLGRE